MARRSLVGVTEMVLCTLTWGTISPIVRSIDSPARVIVGFRLGIGALVVLGVAVVGGRFSELRLAGRPKMLIASGLLLALHWAMLFEAYKRLEPAAAVGIVFVGPVLAAASAPFILRERLRGRAMVALGVAVVGIGFITLPEAGALDPRGVVAAAGAAVSFAGLIVIGKLLTQSYGTFALTTWQLGIAAIPGMFGAVGHFETVAKDWPVLVLLGVVHTGLAGLLFFRALDRLPAQTVGTLFYLEPASAVVYAWLFLSLAPSASVVVGLALVVAAGLGIIADQMRTERLLAAEATR